MFIDDVINSNRVLTEIASTIISSGSTTIYLTNSTTITNTITNIISTETASGGINVVVEDDVRDTVISNGANYVSNVNTTISQTNTNGTFADTFRSATVITDISISTSGTLEIFRADGPPDVPDPTGGTFLEEIIDDEVDADEIYPTLVSNALNNATTNINDANALLTSSINEVGYAEDDLKTRDTTQISNRIVLLEGYIEQINGIRVVIFNLELGVSELLTAGSATEFDDITESLVSITGKISDNIDTLKVILQRTLVLIERDEEEIRLRAEATARRIALRNARRVIPIPPRGVDNTRASRLSRTLQLAGTHTGKAKITRVIMANNNLNSNGVYAGAPYFRSRDKMNKF